MKMNRLGRTDVMVSELCLGSMTWGSQNNLDEAHEQIVRALDAGINFIDTAEMYPVTPILAETVGRTERIIGQWFERGGRREDFIVATKHSGAGFRHTRGGAPITGQSIPEVIEGNLRRLNTDYIDLYQLHWPNRGSYAFRQNWTFDATDQDHAETIANMEEVIDALEAERKRGTIRHFGLSNESAWGLAQWVRIAEARGGPRAVSVQNEYSLLCRLFDTDMAELAHHEDVGLLAYSPLATGLLTGKYQNGAVPEGSRKAIGPDLGGRNVPRAYEAVALYLGIAAKHGLDPVQMAIAWAAARPFMTSVIFGATSIPQLDRILGASGLSLSEEVLNDIDAAHRACPMPY
ncbi:aldo/keto reductase [Poseidonocella sedimentorum]|uniref:Predicted oxidoreductase n=1 Tax=Poseidonocella sedimentorum TaxID=871652 RepID=A0A1I6D2J0_9RHOB|nr:aldo/keto reductase [Poseidonocella sedimentorum]SFQ99610.1 Predicted oxidoreductase [Poseidonocella sedimentorum]